MVERDSNEAEEKLLGLYAVYIEAIKCIYLAVFIWVICSLNVKSTDSSWKFQEYVLQVKNHAVSKMFEFV